MEAKKMVLKSSIQDEKCRRKVLKAVAKIPGVDSVSLDMKDGKITVIGEADPVFLAGKLRKCGIGYTELLTVGPAKEEKKNDKKEEKKYDKKEEKKYDKKDEKKPETPIVVHVPWYGPCECSCICEENPNACTIC